MEKQIVVKPKKRRGPPKKAFGEKKIPVTVWVKGKDEAAVQAECDRIADKYEG